MVFVLVAEPPAAQPPEPQPAAEQTDPILPHGLPTLPENAGSAAPKMPQSELPEPAPAEPVSAPAPPTPVVVGPDPPRPPALSPSANLGRKPPRAAQSLPFNLNLQLKPSTPAVPAPLAPAATPPVHTTPIQPPVTVDARPIRGLAGNCTPEYPATALRRGQQGIVTIRVTVSPEGRALAATVARSSGTPALDAAALTKVLRDCRFLPASRNGTPVEGVTLQPMHFQIQE